jgi:hypothetical protein
MFLPDLMHDFELGGWRCLFIHLLRILDSIDPNLQTEVDRRYVLHFSPRSINNPLRSYREIPPFGKDAIRKFPNSASQMKRLAARDLENLLQVRRASFDDESYLTPSSAQFQYSMVSCLSPITVEYLNSSF